MSAIWKSPRLRPGLLLATALLVAIVWGCDRAPGDLLLSATGERVTPGIGVISGHVSVSGGPSTLPPIRVFAFRDADTTCVSQYQNIQVLGNHTTPPFSVATTPVMQRLVGCTWVDSIYLDPNVFAGIFQWKFVTNKNFDNPPDYGSPGSQVDGLEGKVVNGAPGDDGNLKAEVQSAGPYLALLDEQKLRYSIVAWDDAPLGDVNRQTGEFAVDQLKDGTYTLIFKGTGLVTRRLTRVVLAGGQSHDVGNVTLASATLAIQGSVGFQDNPSPRPTATVQLYAGAEPAPRSELQTSDAFSFTGLENGTYHLKLKAAGYRDSLVTTVYSGTLVDLGTIVLRKGCSSQFDRIQVAGNLNTALYGNFDLSKSPDMTKTGGCVWQATLNGITAGDHFFKFVTNGAFDTPPDYGGNEVCTANLTGPVQAVQGTGTALCVTFPEDGNYRFTLDEEALTYAIEKVVVNQPGRIIGTVSFGGTPPAGLKAFVQVFEGGTNNQAASDSTAASFSFPGLAAGNYDVKFSAAGYEARTRQATVIASQTTDLGDTRLDPGFTSKFNKIEVIGDFPGVNWDPALAPDMTQNPPGVWKALVTGITGGNHLFKFRTNDNWETPDGDYGSPTDESCKSDMMGTVKLLTAYPAPALCVIFPAGTADYEFTLDEKNLTYVIARQGQTGQGGVSGVVIFGGIAAPPYPAAAVHLQMQGGSTDIGSTTVNATTGAFAFTQLDEGTYKILVANNCFQTATRENVVLSGTSVNVGTIDLVAVPSAFSIIQLAGTFNGFDLGSTPGMTHLTGYSWVDTVLITEVSQPVEFKFVTGGAYDTPPDYGMPGDQVDPTSGTCVFGAPGSAGNIKVDLSGSGAGSYEFRLDERYPSYTVVKLATASRPAGSGRGR